MVDRRLGRSDNCSILGKREPCSTDERLKGRNPSQPSRFGLVLSQCNPSDLDKNPTLGLSAIHNIHALTERKSLDL